MLNIVIAVFFASKWFLSHVYWLGVAGGVQGNLPLFGNDIAVMMGKPFRNGMSLHLVVLQNHRTRFYCLMSPSCSSTLQKLFEKKKNSEGDQFHTNR